VPPTSRWRVISSCSALSAPGAIICPRACFVEVPIERVP
jgi:hypothetical protein